MVYVLNKEGKPLMPTKRYGKVRHLLKNGEATVISKKPFTIKLLCESKNYTQEITLGIDAGYSHIGLSCVTKNSEVFSGELNLINNQPQRTEDKSKHRRARRIRLRHRKPRFDNRKRNKEWLAPTIQNKLDQHIKIVDKIKTILPITKIIIEVATFDIQAIKDPDIEGKQYQEGEQSGFWNLREYILHRDEHSCQNPNCKHKKDLKVFDYIKNNIPLQIHHIGFWKNDGSDRPGNLITLCVSCHKTSNHKKEKFLFGWEPQVKSFRPETFMSTIRWRLKNAIDCDFTYGYITKSKRIELKLEKTHYNDAFCIANGKSSLLRNNPLIFAKKRRNNRVLQTFYDAVYLDLRSGEKVKASTLDSGRRKRNKQSTKNDKNLRKYRGEKISKGRVQIRRQRYSIQPGTELIYQNKKYIAIGVHCKGERVLLKTSPKNKSVKISDVEILFIHNSYIINTEKYPKYKKEI